MIKNSKLATLIILQILAQAVSAQQEPQQPVQYAPQQPVQYAPQQPVQYEQQQQPQYAPQQPYAPPQYAPQQPAQYEQQQPVQYAPQQPYAQPQYAPQQMPQQAAQQEPQKPGAPVNTITIDFGPTLVGFIIGTAGGAAGDEFDISGFGWGAQYERQIFDQLSIAGKFAYLGIDTKYTTEDNSGDKAKANMDLSSFSIEAHPRVYPFGGSFFLDGTLGYANMSMDFSGRVYDDDDFGNSIPESYKFSISRSYLKYGLKLGWRADFGEPGGFIFEHSYGYYWASGSGKTMGKQLEKEFDEDVPDDLDDAFSYFEDYVFVGGPRVTFAFGWKF